MSEFSSAAEAFYSDPTRLPCGCNAAQARYSGRCVCDPEWLNERGECERRCRACEVVWTGERVNVVDAMLTHCSTEEHAATYNRRQFELRREDEATRLQEAGMLF